MTISATIQGYLKSSSWIRKMFETGQAMKQQLGEDNVFDLSLGNPINEPPPAFIEELRRLVNSDEKGLHRYMPNPGYHSTRAVMADNIGRREDLQLVPEDVVMTVGAAGALNVALAALLNRGEQVIILAPYFVEYIFYARTHGGEPVVVQTTEDFDLDLEAIEAAITPSTKAIILNTPNNPTGRVYSQQRMDQLGELLNRCEAKLGSTIYLLHDTPYSRIIYDGLRNPRLFNSHPSTLVAHSFSKDLGLAGERIGYLAVSPRAPHREELQAALAFTNRTLGFVNAPALMQRVVEKALEAPMDLAPYVERREMLCRGLEQAGYDFVRPGGAFYVFPRTPIPDDILFAGELAKEHVLVVPGSGFGRKGHIRIAYCASRRSIEGAIPVLARVRDRLLE